MCEVWPGPRCSHDMEKKRKARERTLQEKEAALGKESSAYLIAKAKYDYATEEWNATPKGIDALEMKADRFPNQRNLDILAKARRTRTMQSNALKEIQNGRLHDVASLNHVASPFYDVQEMNSVVEASREYHERYALKHQEVSLEQVSSEEYRAYVEGLKQDVVKRQGHLTEDQTTAYNRLLNTTPPDRLTMKAYDYVPKALDRSQKALQKELTRIAHLQGVSKKTAQAYYEAYRNQYRDNFANLPELQRPDPPKDWVRGELPQSGYTQDPFSEFAPRDPASVYAVYRLRSDDDAIPDFLKSSRTIASVDLETASPTPKTIEESYTLRKPENGRIIEVGIVCYTPKGKEISKYSQLVRPEQSFLDAHGTGMVEVHNIKVEDLNGAPSWPQVMNKVSRSLEGKIMLGQNVPYENDWFGTHLNGFKENLSRPMIDTLDISRKHLDLPNHKLPTICGAMGVTYSKDKGHRADYDAEVTALSYFEMKKHIKKTWNSKPARKNAPVIEEVPLGSRWDSWVPLVPYKKK